MSELLPCPFCGGEAKIVESDYGMHLTGYAIYCHKCCLKMGVTGELGEADEWIPVFDTEAEAIAAWNERAERTCKVESCLAFSYDFSPEIYYEFKMECGGQFDSIDEEPPRYCPNCGARVIKSDQDL